MSNQGFDFGSIEKGKEKIGGKKKVHVEEPEKKKKPAKQEQEQAPKRRRASSPPEDLEHLQYAPSEGGMGWITMMGIVGVGVILGWFILGGESTTTVVEKEEEKKRKPPIFILPVPTGAYSAKESTVEE